MSNFSKRDAQRVARQIRFAETTPNFTATAPVGSKIAWGAKLFVTTSTITAMSGSTLGSGTGTMQLVDLASGVMSATTFTGLTLWSYFSTTIPTGTTVVAVPLDGGWLIDGVAC